MNYQIVPLSHEAFTGINLVLKDEEMNVLGGITGEIKTPSLAYIHHLWIDEAHRNKDLGTRLLQAFEKTAHRQGCRQVETDTFEYQAPIFYEKNGYVCYEILADNTTPYRRLYYRKEIFPI
jgi:GNAT superfamily N-acetyltransferase